MDEFKVGEMVHLGFGAKGGAGYIGRIVSLEGTKVKIEVCKDVEYLGQVKNLSKVSNSVQHHICRNTLGNSVVSLIIAL